MTKSQAINYLCSLGISGERIREVVKALGESKTDILDKIKAEIDSYCSDNRDRNDGLYIAMRIIDKYRQEVEE